MHVAVRATYLGYRSHQKTSLPFCDLDSPIGIAPLSSTVGRTVFVGCAFDQAHTANKLKRKSPRTQASPLLLRKTDGLRPRREGDELAGLRSPLLEES